MRASARKKAFGGRLQQAKRSACPTRGWGKPSLQPVAADGHGQQSALRADVAFVFFPLHLSSSAEPSKAVKNRPVPTGRDRDSAPPAIGAHGGLQAVRRCFLTSVKVSLSSGVPHPLPDNSFLVDRTPLLPAGQGEWCSSCCRSTSYLCHPCSWCAPP